MGEIEGRSFHRAQFARRNQCPVDRRNMVAFNHQLVAENVASPLARQIKVGMIREIHYGIFVSRGGIRDGQFILIVECVDNFGIQVSRKAFLAIRTQVGQLQSLALRTGHLFRRP